MHRLILLIIVWLALAPLQSGRADADAPLCTRGLDGSYLVCEGSTSSVPPGSSLTIQNAATNSVGSGGTTRKYFPYNRLVTGADGQPCVTTGYYAEGTSPNDAAITDPVTQNVQDIHNLPALEYPPCPVQAGSPRESAPVETPSMIAMRYWEQVRLPKPDPYVAPGRAITGKIAYLETRGVVTRTYTNPTTVYGQLVIVASGSYEVDWGDGTTTGPHSYEGGAWPEGRITHVYRDVGSYNIVVREKWTATWSLGGERGLLRTLGTAGNINDFPVEQIQAVVGR